jgi:hypothetical protein
VTESIASQQITDDATKQRSFLSSAHHVGPEDSVMVKTGWGVSLRKPILATIVVGLVLAVLFTIQIINRLQREDLDEVL